MTKRMLAVVAGIGLMACGSRTPTLTPPPNNGPFDVILEGGRVVDGTGAAWFYGDVALIGDRIARIAPAGVLKNASAKERIDARGLVVAPGFIDIQSHSRDTYLTGDGIGVSKLTQGITTEIMGEGSTNAPQNGKTDIAGSNADPRRGQKFDFSGPRGFDTWLKAMQAHGTAANFGSFVGAATIRMYAKGMAQGDPTPAELDSMRMVTRNAMEDGAFGVASALIYPPGNYATTKELIEISKAMAPYGGVYITHMRSEADQWLEAIDEALRIGKEGGVPVEIYHLKAGGKRNWNKTPLAIAKIDSARSAGQDIQADMYAYTAGGTGLSACTPPWASADGKLITNLKDEATWKRIRTEMDAVQNEWENLCQLATPDGVLVLGLYKPATAKFAGKRLAEIASAMGKDWEDTIRELLIEENQRIGTVYFMMSEENVKTKLQQPWIKIGTDAGGVSPENARSLVHPRAYGNYPRILGKYVRDEHVLTLEDAIRKMSSAVATRLSIGERGVLRPGLYADVVVFDPATIADRATYDQPHQLSVGMKYVFVNGTAVIRDGKVTGAKPGRIVRGPGWKGGK